MLYLYPVISVVYLAVPVIALALTGWAAHRQKRPRPVQALFGACTIGAILGGMVAVLYAWAGGVRVPLTQVLLACYLGVAAMCIVHGLNRLLFRGVGRVFRIDARAGQDGCCPWAQAIAGVFQAVLLIALAMPFLCSLLVLYRPKAPSGGNPQTLIDAEFQTVHLHASDGTSLEAWWIPATHNGRTDGRGSANWGRDTVLLCHGFGADKAADLFLARDLVANGYNILAIDLRAHGHSGGNFTGFGGIESRDVLGAVRWLRGNHPDEAHRILGLGEGLGAVALIEAAADPGSEGQAISAIAAYNPYDDLRAVIGQLASQHTIRAGQWAFSHAVLPVASAQLGSDLAELSPGRALRALWPRPILVIGDPTSRDPVYGRSFELYQDAFQPKYGYFRDDLDPAGLLHDRNAALTVRIFFDGEQSLL